jgi:hypothetical protein
LERTERTVPDRGGGLLVAAPWIFARHPPRYRHSPGKGLRVVLQVRSPAARASEIYGSVAPTVTRVVAVLRNGDRAEALTGGGWFILSVDTGHPAPTRLLAFDASGSRVGEIIPLY